PPNRRGWLRRVPGKQHFSAEPDPPVSFPPTQFLPQAPQVSRWYSTPYGNPKQETSLRQCRQCIGDTAVQQWLTPAQDGPARSGWWMPNSSEGELLSPR